MLTWIATFQVGTLELLIGGNNMGALWLPGQGMVSLEGTAVDRAVREYDERLFFARNTETGYYTIFRKDTRGNDPFPIMAFPEVPSTEEVLDKLRRSDAQRQGDRILDELHRANDKIKERARRDADDATGQLAEGMESFLHGQSLTPYYRSLRPLKKTAVKGH